MGSHTVQLDGMPEHQGQIGTEMDLKSYLKIIRNRWWLLLLGPVLAGAIAFYVSKQMTPTYATSATLLINQTQTPGTVQYNDILTSERLTNTYAELVERQVSLASVISQLDLEMSETELRKKISVSAVSHTQLLRIAVEDADPILASAIANETAIVFINDNASSLGRPGTVTIAERAEVPEDAAKPNIQTNTILAAILGLMAISALALLIEYLDDTVKAGEDVELEFGLPTLGLVRRMKQKSVRVTAPFDAESIEAYVQLRTNVHFAAVGRNLKSIVVTSSHPKEGKSTTAAGLATVLAQAGAKVILVDADLRRPAVHEVFSLPNKVGLTGLLVAEATEARPALFSAGIKNLSVLTSGPVPPNPADLLMSTSMENLMQSLANQADYVIYDTPPVLAVTDANILAARADGVVLVGLSGRTRKSSLRSTVQEISRTQAKILGFAINKAGSQSRGYYGNYGYGYTSKAATAMEKGKTETSQNPNRTGKAA